MKKLTLLATILMVVMAINVACQKDNARAVSQTVIDLVNSAGDLPGTGLPRQDRTEEVVRDTSWIERHNLPPAGLARSMSNVDCFVFNTEWNCVTVRVSAAENPDDFAMLNPLASVLWPGNLVQGASLASGIPTTIPIDPSRRQPGTISLAIVGGGSENRMYRTVDRMSFSAVNQAMNEILAGFEGHGFAQYSFQMDFIESAQELEFKLNASFSGWGASARAGFTSNFADNRTRVLIRLHQAFFTMVFDDPPGLDGVFTPEITVNDLRNYVGNGNPICYISSVTYGRVFYLFYESTATREALSAALNFSFRGFGIEAGVDAERQFRETMEKTTARVFQIGGDAAGGLTAGMALDLTAIRDFLEAGANFSAENPGAPISYTVKFLKNAQLVRLNSAMEFEVNRCEPGRTTITECPEPPQLSTSPVSVITITSTSARLGGNITNEGTPPYFERGVIISTQPIANNFNLRIEPISGTGTGAFSQIITGLLPNTEYFVVAYAANENGVVYGEEVSFRTSEGAMPVVTTNNARNITTTTATLGGTITSDDPPVYIERGVVFSTSPNPTTENGTRIPIQGTGTGIFETQVTELTANTSYYVRAYLIGTNGVPHYGELVSFRTQGDITFTTNPARNIMATSAILGGTIVNVGSPPFTERGVVWATTPNPTIYNNRQAIAGVQTGSFEATVGNLTPNTTYFVRTYVISAGNVIYGQQVSFRTVESYRQYIDGNGVIQVVPNHIAVLNFTNQTTLGAAGATLWYRVNGTRNITERITIAGDVRIILEDGAQLNANAGINVTGNNRLTIYAQSTGGTMGRLIATASPHNAGIGGDAGQAGGNITINGGEIRAFGGEAGAGQDAAQGGNPGLGGGGAGAGIGGGGGLIDGLVGGAGGAGGFVTINGGLITAIGGVARSGGTGAMRLTTSLGGGGGGGQGAAIGGGGGGGGIGGIGIQQANRNGVHGGNNNGRNGGRGGNGGLPEGQALPGGVGGNGGSGSNVRINGGTINGV